MRLYDRADQGSREFVEKICASMFPVEQTELVRVLIEHEHVTAPDGATDEMLWYVVRSPSIAEKIAGVNGVVIISELGCWWGINDRDGEMHVTPAKHNATWLVFSQLIEDEIRSRSICKNCK